MADGTRNARIDFPGPSAGESCARTEPAKEPVSHLGASGSLAGKATEQLAVGQKRQQPRDDGRNFNGEIIRLPRVEVTKFRTKPSRASARLRSRFSSYVAPTTVQISFNKPSAHKGRVNLRSTTAVPSEVVRVAGAAGGGTEVPWGGGWLKSQTPRAAGVVSHKTSRNFAQCLQRGRLQRAQETRRRQSGPLIVPETAIVLDLSRRKKKPGSRWNSLVSLPSRLVRCRLVSCHWRATRSARDDANSVRANGRLAKQERRNGAAARASPFARSASYPKAEKCLSSR